MGIERHDRLHSVESAAEFLGFVSASTIRSWLTQWKLTRVKVSRLTRVRESELVTLIQTQEKPLPAQSKKTTGGINA